MKKALIGKKVGMTQVFREDGVVVPVTVIELGPNVVVQKKTKETDGYDSLKVGFSDVKESRVTKAILGIFKKNNLAPKKVVKEIELFDAAIEEGAVLTCDLFAENEIVNVTGISKGKGFAGTMKRYNFKGGRASHGSSFHRAPGSMGANTYPGEIWKGKKLPGRMGSDTVTVKNLKIVKVLKDTNTVLVSGAVPGKNDSIVIVRER